MQSDLSDRISHALKVADISPDGLSSALSVSRSTVYRWLSGGTKPYRKYLDGIADLTHADPRWLQTGQGKAPGETSDRQMGQPDELAAESDDVASVLQSIVAVPFFGRVGAGHPRLPLLRIGEVRVSSSEYALDFGSPPRASGSAYEAHPRFGYFTVDGDSAAPAFFDGDRLPVEVLDGSNGMGGDSFVNDLLYVFRWNGMLQLKRLRRLPGGMVQATSLNPAIEPFYFNPIEDAEEFDVVAVARVNPKQQLYQSLLGRFLRESGDLS